MKAVKQPIVMSDKVKGTRRQRVKKIFDKKKEEDRLTKIEFKEFREKERKRAGSIWQSHKDIINVLRKGNKETEEEKKDLNMTEEEIEKNDSFFEPLTKEELL